MDLSGRSEDLSSRKSRVISREVRVQRVAETLDESELRPGDRSRRRARMYPAGMTIDYVPPAAWTWNRGSGGQFANINRPISGPTHDKELPVGAHPLQRYAPTKIEYAIDRFAMEVKRQLDVLDKRLATSEHLAGSEYTLADIAVWLWYRMNDVPA